MLHIFKSLITIYNNVFLFKDKFSLEFCFKKCYIRWKTESLFFYMLTWIMQTLRGSCQNYTYVSIVIIMAGPANSRIVSFILWLASILHFFNHSVINFIFTFFIHKRMFHFALHINMNEEPSESHANYWVNFPNKVVRRTY